MLRSFTCRLEMPSGSQSTIGVLFLGCIALAAFCSCDSSDFGRLQMGAGFNVNDVSSEMVTRGNAEWGTELKACK